MKRRWNFPRKPTPRASPSSGPTHPFPATSCGLRRPALSRGTLDRDFGFSAALPRAVFPLLTLYCPRARRPPLPEVRSLLVGWRVPRRSSVRSGLSVLQAAETREAASRAGLSPAPGSPLRRLCQLVTRGERGTCVWLPPRRRRGLAAPSAEFCT